MIQILIIAINEILKPMYTATMILTNKFFSSLLFYYKSLRIDAYVALDW